MPSEAGVIGWACATPPVDIAARISAAIRDKPFVLLALKQRLTKFADSPSVGFMGFSRYWQIEHWAFWSVTDRFCPSVPAG